MKITNNNVKSIRPSSEIYNYAIDLIKKYGFDFIMRDNHFLITTQEKVSDIFTMGHRKIFYKYNNALKYAIKYANEKNNVKIIIEAVSFQN